MTTRSVLRQIEQFAFAIGDKAQRFGKHLDIDAFCGKSAWVAVLMDPQMFRAMVQWDESPDDPMALTAICYGMIWPVCIILDRKLHDDAIELRDRDGRVLLDLRCGETVEPAPLGLMTDGE